MQGVAKATEKGSRRGERLLTDARVRSATLEADGPYLRDGGGLRIRLLPPSRNYPRGAKLAQYEYRSPATGTTATLGLGTLGEPFTDATGRVRPFTLADARAARDTARDQVAQGVDPRDARKLARAEAVEAIRTKLAEHDARRTVRTAFDEWERLYLTAHRKDGGAFVRAMFDRDVLPQIGDEPLDALRRARIADTLDRIVTRGARRTANMALALLRQFVRWCIARDWMQSDPTIGLSKATVGGKDTTRERVLSSMEIIALRDALPASGLRPRMQAAIWLLLATGARVGELSAARVADLDLDAGEWRLPATKNGKPHLIHLSDFAVGHARTLVALGEGSQWLLPAADPTRRAAEDDDDDDGDGDDDAATPTPRDDSRPIGDKIIAKAIADRQRSKPLKGRSKASAALALPGGKWTPHDLRRTFATRARDIGISSDVIERCLNHTPQGIVGVYQRGDLLPERRAAFETWGDELQRLMTLDATNVRELGATRRAAA
jgi:integrase